MGMFTKIYDKALSWSKHKYAERYLGILSFTESFIFPIPPDVMLAPMSMSKPDKALRFAFITTIASVLGGILGYMIGLFFFNTFLPFFEQLGWMEKFTIIQAWFDKWGVVAVFIAGFTPIPYKIFTVASGVAGFAFLPFVAASFVGRGARFYLVALLMAWGGEAMEKQVRRFVEWLGWALVVLIAVFVVYKYFT